MNELLQEIQAANKCDKCDAAGKVPIDTAVDIEHWIWGPCPSCTGGFIVPELERTENIYVTDGNEGAMGLQDGSIPRNHGGHWGYVNPAYIIPSPTLPEILDMLPDSILKDESLILKKAPKGYYEAGFKGDRKKRWYKVCIDESPLIAALKLLLWYIKQRKEGK